MNESLLFIAGLIIVILLLISLSMKSRMMSAAVLIPVIFLCWLAFTEIRSMLYMEKIILYNDWIGFYGVSVILAVVFGGAILEVIIKAIGFEIKS